MRRFIMYFRMYKMIIIVISIVLLLLILSVIGLASLESFYRKMTIATMPVQFLMAGIHAGIFVFMYLIFLRGGFAKLDKAPIKGKDVEVRWKDVIGMEAAKQEAVKAGAAKAAVVASSFFGTISGSAVANTVGTGSFTIPLIIKSAASFQPM